MPYLASIDMTYRDEDGRAVRTTTVYGIELFWETNPEDPAQERGILRTKWHDKISTESPTEPRKES